MLIVAAHTFLFGFYFDAVYDSFGFRINVFRFPGAPLVYVPRVYIVRIKRDPIGGASE